MLIYNFIKRIVLFLIIFFVATEVVAQDQNKIWFFGKKAGLDFNTSPPAAIQSDLSTLEGTASICDPSGNLLFYTNGEDVWDRDHNIMPNGDGLKGGQSSTQAALILPLPNSCTKYYIFVTEDHFTDGGLSYSIVDMCLNDGYGDIISGSKSIILADQTAEKITAIPHSNGNDIWIISHKLNSRDFLAYLLTPSGVTINPVISTVGSFYNSQAHIGPVKASHNGTKIVSSATFYSIVEMFDFDAATGVLSNAKDITQIFGAQQYVYGIEFSPNDSLLYLSSTFVISTLYQLNLSTFELTVLNTQTGNYHYGALQMGSNQKIYMARNDSSFLDVIHAPNNPGTSSQYEEKGVKLLNGTFSTLGLPNFAPYSYFRNNSPVLFLGNDTLICNGETLPLKINLTTSCGAFSYHWSTGSNESEIVVSQPGIYWVEITNACATFRDSIQVSFAACQPICNQAIGSIFGSAFGMERGYSLASAKDNKSFYVAGLKGDSVHLLNLDLSGHVLWARTFDIVPGEIDHVDCIIVDSEGMIAMSGLSGNILSGDLLFSMRYDPITDKVLWAKTYMSTNVIYPGPIIQKGSGGNYLMTSNPHKSITDDSEILELDKNTGEVVLTFAKHYHLGSSETLFSMAYDNDYVYGVGRYTDGADKQDMRQTIIKLNANTGIPVWTKLGHFPAQTIARLYGFDIVIHKDTLYSGFFGDPTGTTLSNTKLYLQKTDTDGNVIWLKQYELPGANDVGIKMIQSEDGLVILAGKRAFPSELILYKVDFDGNLLWSRLFQFPGAITSIGNTHAKSNQLIQAGDKLAFTGYGTNPSGGTNMIVVITNLKGETDMPCVNDLPLAIQVTTLNNGVFYSVNPVITNVNPPTKAYFPESNITGVQLIEQCVTEESFSSIVDISICEGDIYEGYSVSGVFVDSFITATGCDSIRTLHLTVVPQSEVFFITKTICQGESFESYYLSGVYTDTFPIGSGCDSIRVLELIVNEVSSHVQYSQICAGETFEGYSTSGIYTDTFINVVGCDSIRILDLTVSMTEIFIDTILCDNSKFENYSVDGFYIDTFLGNSIECDTIRYLSLSYDETVLSFLSLNICKEETYLGYSETGIYSDTFKMSTGCDSIRILDLVVTNQILLDEDISICEGETYNGHTTAGIYTDTLRSFQSCDTIHTFFLSVIEPIQKFSFATLCKGINNGYTRPGTYIDTLTSAAGCDSIVILELKGFTQFIPNVFSPNNDGINDVFSIYQLPEAQIEIDYFAIFDRFGNMAYETSSLPIVWEGEDKDGYEYQAGVFAYILIYFCESKQIVENGNITLLK